MLQPELIVAPDPQTLAAEVAARLITSIVDAQAARSVASIVLTGGGIGTATLAAVAQSPAVNAVDWASVDIWWGDERYLPEGDPERNETGAREVLLSVVPIDETRVHPMPAAGDDAAAGARAYAEQLRERAPTGTPCPAFDVLMLGIGPEGHVASLFPHTDGIGAADTVVAVFDSPKPPPTRISLTLAAIGKSREVWIIASGQSKADAVARTMNPETAPEDVPAAGARGTERTLLFADQAAASSV